MKYVQKQEPAIVFLFPADCGGCAPAITAASFPRPINLINIQIVAGAQREHSFFR